MIFFICVDWLDAETVLGWGVTTTRTIWLVILVIEYGSAHDAPGLVQILAAAYVVATLMPDPVERLTLLLVIVIIHLLRTVRSRVDEVISRTRRFKYIGMIKSLVKVVVAGIHESFTKLSSRVPTMLSQSFFSFLGFVNVIPEHWITEGIHIPPVGICGGLGAHGSRRKPLANSIAMLDLGKVFGIIGPSHQRITSPAMAGAAG